MIRVRTLGAAEIEIDGHRISARSESTFSLALYLCVRAGERIARAQLAELFWPSSDEAAGRHSLRQLLYRLRKAGFRPNDDGEAIWLDPAEVDCDVRHLLDPRSPDRIDVAAIRNDCSFLPAIREDVSGAFREWLDAMRLRVSAEIMRRAVREIGKARREGRWGSMQSLADLVLANDPLNEEATLAKAESFAMSGAKATAIEILDSYIAELGPRATQISLPPQVLRRRISERRPEWTQRGSREAPLIGREKLMSRLSEQLEGASRGAGSATVLVGAAGVGKSRLLSELGSVAQLRGFTWISVRGDAATATRHLALAVRLAAALRDVVGAAGSSPQALAVVHRLTSKVDSQGGFDTHPTGELSAPRIGWAVAELLSAISVESRVLLTVDDFHHADQESQDVIADLERVAPTLRLAIVSACRPHTTAGDGSAPSQAPSISVPALSAVASTELASALADALAQPLTPTDISSIADASGGNPLFIRELTAFRESPTHLGAVPPTLQSLIDARLSRLPPSHTRVLRLSSLLGSLASLRRLRALVYREDAHFPLASVLEELENDGIIACTSDGSLVVHECWLSCVADGMSTGVRGALGLECAEQLILDRKDSPDAADLLWRAATLFSDSGCMADARRCLTAAGETLLSRGLGVQAGAAFAKALSLTADNSERLSLFCALARSHSRAAAYKSAISVARDGLALSRLVQSPTGDEHVQLLTALADALWREGHPHVDTLADLASAVELSGLSVATRHFACLVGVRLVYLDAASGLGAHFDRVIAESTLVAGPSVFGALGRLVHASERGSVADVRERCRSLTALPLHEEPAFMRTKALHYRAIAHRFVGDVDEAARDASTAAALALESGSPEAAHAIVMFLVHLALDWGDLHEAQRRIAESHRLADSAPPFFLRRETTHAEARILLQSSDPAGCLAMYRDSLVHARNDFMARRRIADSACIALAAARTGDMVLADEMIELTAEVVSNDLPSSQLDFPAECLAQALHELGRTNDAALAASAYLSRRRASYDRPIPRAFTALRAYANTLGEAPLIDDRVGPSST